MYNMNNENNERVAGLDRRCGCKLCEENFDHREKLGKFKSTITGTAFDTNIGDGNLPPCKTDCVLYMITCSNCNIQCIGQTKNSYDKESMDIEIFVRIKVNKFYIKTLIQSVNLNMLNLE